MGRSTICIPALLLLLFFSACEKEWNTLAPWEERYAVYGIINLKDTAQYIRISRIFAIEDDPAGYLENADSVNIQAEDFEVWMEDYLDDVKAGPDIIFHPSGDYLKEEGAFTGGHYQTFKTTQWLKVGHTYRLMVKNKLTGYTMTASVTPLGLRTLDQAFIETRYVTAPQYKPERIDYWKPLMPDQYDIMIQRLLYYEYSATDTVRKVLDWRPWLTKSTAEDTTEQLTDDYLKYIAASIPVKPGITRKAVGIDKVLILNDKELQLYIDIIEEQGSLHFDPVYTNFNRGTGLFASRYYYTFFGMLLKPRTLDTIAHGRFTKELGFLDSQGNQQNAQ